MKRYAAAASARVHSGHSAKASMDTDALALAAGAEVFVAIKFWVLRWQSCSWGNVIEGANTEMWRSRPRKEEMSAAHLTEPGKNDTHRRWQTCELEQRPARDPPVLRLEPVLRAEVAEESKVQRQLEDAGARKAQREGE